MSTRPDAGEIEGSPTVEPAFNLPALWIDKERKSNAEMEGYTVVEPAGVLATHLAELVRGHADELLSRQDVKDMCESIREFAPALIEDLIPDKVPVNTLHNVLTALLHERIPVKDIVTILETLANYNGTGLNHDFLVGKVREALGRSITALYTDQRGSLQVVSLHPRNRAGLDAGGAGFGSGRGSGTGPGLRPDLPGSPRKRLACGLCLRASPGAAGAHAYPNFCQTARRAHISQLGRHGLHRGLILGVCPVGRNGGDQWFRKGRPGRRLMISRSW